MVMLRSAENHNRRKTWILDDLGGANIVLAPWNL
jgi:hypothetical protein